MTKKVYLAAFILYFTTVIFPQGTWSAPVCRSNLSRLLSPILQKEPLAHSHLGISLRNLKDGDVLYELNPSNYFTPASNAKILTTAAALYLLGENFTFSTAFFFNGQNLLIVGGGDPSLSSSDLVTIAQRLKQSRLKQIHKLLILTRDKAASYPSTWEWGDLAYDYASIAGLINLNQNAFSITLSPTQPGQIAQLSFSDPQLASFVKINNLVLSGEENGPIEVINNNSLELRGKINQPISLDLSLPSAEDYFLESFAQTLKENQISVAHTGKISTIPAGYYKITEFHSPPLSIIIKKINQDSNNFYAEALFNLLNSKNIQNILENMGVNPKSFLLVDGSGLSRQDLTTPEALVELLRTINKGKQAQVYRDSLAVAGRSGTLKMRFKGTIVEGNLWAKSGTLTGVSALSGYLNPPNYQPIVFSILVNQSPSTNLRQEIDQIILLFSQLSPC